MIDIKEIEPTLTAMGIEGPKTFKTTEMPDLDQIKTCIEWLQQQEITKKVKTKNAITSYGWKHKAERAYKTYVTNGAFIAAVIYLGIPYEKIYDSPNIHVGIKYDRKKHQE